VLRWIIDRCEERVGADELPIGFLPTAAAIDLTGLDVSAEALAQLLSVNTEQWQVEMDEVGKYLDSYGDRLPERLRAEHAKVLQALA